MAGQGAGNGWHEGDWRAMPNGFADHGEAGDQHAEQAAQDQAEPSRLVLAAASRHARA